MEKGSVMYVIKPIIDHCKTIQLPTCMYKMKNIHSIANGEVINGTSNHVSESSANLDTFDQHNQVVNMTEVIQQQERILKQLSELKVQMSTLRDVLRNECPTTITAKSFCSIKNLKIDSQTVILNINPTRPPYLLEVLQQLTKHIVNFEVVPYLHSTVPMLPEKVAESIERLKNFTRKEGLPVITLRVVVKDVGTQNQLLVSFTPIVGDVNILRYFARIIPKLNYDETNFEIDPILDACFCVLEAETKTERMKHIRTISKKLDKSEWLCGSNYTVADIAAYVTLKSCECNELNGALNKFIERCKEKFNN